MSETPNKHKHLEFIQTAISRMAGNLFLFKGWSITLIAALFALAAKDADKAFILIAYFPLVIFWGLDGYFLSIERRFRSLYDHVRQLKEGEIDFSMDTGPFKNLPRNSWASAILSPTLLTYYLSLAAVMIVLPFCIR